MAPPRTPPTGRGPSCPLARSLSQTLCTAAAHIVREPGVGAGSPGLVLQGAGTRRVWEEEKEQVRKLWTGGHGQHWNGHDLLPLLALSVQLAFP